MNQARERSTPIPPWYRQFWPWYLISIPAVAVVAGIAMLVIATQHRDAMVVDNYYKQGLAINRTLEQQRAAAALGLRAQVTIDPHTQLLTLTFAESVPRGEQPLELAFIHATLAQHDHHITLLRYSEGIYRGRLQAMHGGNWNLILQPADGVWRLDAHVSFPATQWEFRPEL